MEYATILYGPLYAAFGIAAALTPNRQDAAAVTITVIERTATTDASEDFELGTLRPGAFVRRREIDETGVSVAELDGGKLAFGGRAWRIEAHSPQPGPDGETSGEILMHLAEDQNA